MNRTTMNQLENRGKRKTIAISLSIVLIALHTIYFYHSNIPEVETKKIVQQIIRFVLTVGLLMALYKGLKWARIIGLVLFAIGASEALIGLVTINAPLAQKTPLLVMTFIYGFAVYHFGFSLFYKAFSAYQRGVKD